MGVSMKPTCPISFITKAFMTSFPPMARSVGLVAQAGTGTASAAILINRTTSSGRETIGT